MPQMKISWKLSIYFFKVTKVFRFFPDYCLWTFSRYKTPVFLWYNKSFANCKKIQLWHDRILRINFMKFLHPRLCLINIVLCMYTFSINALFLQLSRILTTNNVLCITDLSRLQRHPYCMCLIHDMICSMNIMHRTFLLHTYGARNRHTWDAT